MDLDNNAHSVFLLHYHLVLVVKYRRQVFDDAISGRAKEIFAYIAPNYNITLGITIKTMCIYFSRRIQIQK
jgi:putative transposase